MSRSNRARATTILCVAVLALGACSGDDGSKPAAGGNGGGGRPDADACPVAALDRADGPVEITFWHGLNREPEATLTRLTERFNTTQTKVKVTLVNQTGYAEVLRTWVAGLGTPDLPDMAQLEDTATQQMIDTQSTVSIADCIEADGYDTGDFLARVLERYTVDGELVTMPFNVSNLVLYYDRNAFTDAGLDPDAPPATFAEVRGAAEKIKASGFETGLGLKISPGYLENWSAQAGELYADNRNGRQGRATEAVFGGAVGKESFAWMKDMVDSGLARTNPDGGPNGFDNLLGIRSKVNGMTIDTSAALGDISQIVASGQAGGVSLGVGPLPGPDGADGVLVGGASLYISKASKPEKIAASWEFIKFLVQGDTQAEWAAATGYVPIRTSSITEAVLVERWNTEPGYRVSYDQLVDGEENDATAGPVIGDYLGVREIVRDAMTKMLTESTDPSRAVTDAERDATKAIDDYNRRVGG